MGVLECPKCGHEIKRKKLYFNFKRVFRCPGCGSDLKVLLSRNATYLWIFAFMVLMLFDPIWKDDRALFFAVPLFIAVYVIAFWRGAYLQSYAEEDQQAEEADRLPVAIILSILVLFILSIAGMDYLRGLAQY